MPDQVVMNKLESLRRCIARVESKTPLEVMTLVDDLDLQDIIVLNLERAVQVCVDIGMHIIGGLELPAPDTMSQTFRTLAKGGVISPDTAERLTKAVGFRNTAVHAYREIDWEIVFKIATCHLCDFKSFAREVLEFS